MSPDDPALSELLRRRFEAVASPGRWNLAAVAVAAHNTGIWLSDASPSSAFHIGSLTKTMTALTLASASIGSRVALTDPLDAYVAAAAGSAVRLVDLATHTAGYPRLPRAIVLRSLRRPRDPYSCITDRSVDRALARLARKPPSHVYSYSNFGYGVLSRALTMPGNEGFFDVLRREVLDPLGLGATTLDLSDGRDRVAGHDATGRVVPDWHNPALPGCGCLWSTIEDLQRYLIANMYPDDSPLAAALRLVHAPRVAAGPRREVGLGWIISETGRGRVHWHNGGTSGFGAFLGFNPTAGVGVAVVTSRAHGDDLDPAAMSVLADLEAGSHDSGRLGS